MKEKKLTHCLEGVEELRDAVAWANYQSENEHEWQTAEQVLERFRKAKLDDFREQAACVARSLKR